MYWMCICCEIAYTSDQAGMSIFLSQTKCSFWLDRMHIWKHMCIASSTDVHMSLHGLANQIKILFKKMLILVYQDADPCISGYWSLFIRMLILVYQDFCSIKYRIIIFQRDMRKTLMRKLSIDGTAQKFSLLNLYLFQAAKWLIFLESL